MYLVMINVRMIYFIIIEFVISGGLDSGTTANLPEHGSPSNFIDAAEEVISLRPTWKEGTAWKPGKSKKGYERIDRLLFIMQPRKI